MTSLFRPIAIWTIILTAMWAQAQDLAQETETFKRVFRQSRVLPDELVKKTLALPKGERLEFDRNGDGNVDEMWYVDTAKRHTRDETLLVKVTDEDNDMATDGQPDRDSDLYFWDWGADGVIDVVTDYQDDDGDNDVDQMGIFYEKRWKDPKDDITVWWSVDVGDDNLLWYDVNGTYSQRDCQWRTHFSGDELFYQFRLSTDDLDWVNVWEDPFAFYDVDDDLCSEIVVRISAVGHEVKNLRYSIDADNDAFGENTHNYDFSVTALPGPKGLSSESKTNESLMIRGVMTHPAIPWSQTMNFGQNADWGKAMLTWDEINSNTDENPAQDPHERWEGILNAKSKYGDFVQVGGPPSSPYNKRVEVSGEHESPIRLYFDEADHRFHLQDADYGYMDVDYNLDGKVDAIHTWKDSKKNGQFDIHTVDVDGNGSVDFTQELNGGGKKYGLTFEAISPKYVASIDKALKESQAFIDTALAGLGKTPANVQEVIDYFKGPINDYHPETELGTYIQNSSAGARFYVELVRDRLYMHVMNTIKKGNGWKRLRKEYRAGDYASAQRTLAKVYGRKKSSEGAPLKYRGETYTEFVEVQQDGSNTPQIGLNRSPVTVDVETLTKNNPNFNPNNCVVVDGDYWLTWRVIPHQVDTYNFSGGTTLSFLANLNRDGQQTYRIYYLPEGAEPTEYTKLTNAVSENPGYIAWESDAGAYRNYTGQFDFFGKKVARKLTREERLLFPITADYHTEQDWGMDALHVGKTSGLGGITIYQDKNAYPVQSPAGEGTVKFTYRVLGSGPVRSAVEIVVTNVFSEAPEKAVTLRAFIYAKHPESEIHVQLPEGLKRPQIGVGLQNIDGGTHFGSAKTGYLGTWGQQDTDIGEIGMAVFSKSAHSVIDSENERQLICDLSNAKGKSDGADFRYWILGEWQRGMQYPTTQNGGNWERRVSDFAKGLR